MASDPMPGARPAKHAGSRGGVSRWARSALFRRLALPIALAVTAIVHWPALDTFFAQDDVTFLSRARGLAPVPWSMARPLSEGVLWRVLHGAFGLNPLPYHVFLMAIHLANVTLVWAIGRHLLRSNVASLAAAVLFGASSIAFTPLHWTSCVVELTVTLFALGSFWAWLEARERGSMPWLLVSAVLCFAALVSKESAILLPLAFLVAHLRLEPRYGGAGTTSRARTEHDERRTGSDEDAATKWTAGKTLVPPFAAAALYAIAFLVTIRRVHYVGSEAYSMTGSPPFLLANLATYLRWLVTPWVPVRDAIAAMDPTAMPVGLGVAAVVVALLFWQRRERRHPMEVGATWFACLLLPVVPLAHHTYLYYLYLPLAGLCWFVARVGRIALRVSGERMPAAAPLVQGIAAALLLAFVANEFVAVRARERAMRGNFPLDKTLREAMLLRNVIADFDSARIAAGSAVAFVNPAPWQHVALVDSTRARGTVSSYVPLEGALRGGEALRLFHPDLRYLGFRDHLPRDWEHAEVLLFQDDGNFRPLGRGGRALAALGYFLLPLHEWERAEGMLLRSRELGDTLADATFGLIITRDFLGDRAGSDAYAREFMRRWPDDPRVATIRASGSTVTP